MTVDTPRVAPIDYVDRWRQLVAAREAQGRRLDRLGDRPDHWAGDRAARFRRMTMRPGAADPLLTLIRPLVGPNSSVLDVGAGTGRHVLPLAPLVAAVTAVEPSAAMRDQLTAVVREADLGNVKIIASGWPTDEAAPADLVICSHVAYFVAAIEPFLRQIDRVSRGRAFVVLRHQQREIAILDLFERIWGETRCPEPSFADLFGVACQLGIYPNVATIPFSAAAGFEAIDDAVPMIQADLLNPEGPDVERKITDYLRERMVHRDGRWQFDVPPTSAGVLWWEASV
ncbi:MAG: class I SAM-dependent methyltransferase [Chloroflexota bacterium]